MGKRAAAKPKASSGNSAAAKRHKPIGSSLPPPNAPKYWGRPEPPVVKTDAGDLRFFLVDIEDCPAGPDSLEQELRLYGVTEGGLSVCARIQGMRPYFYARCPQNVRGCEEDLRTTLDAATSSALRGLAGTVLKVETVRRTPALVFQPEVDLLRITVAGPRVMTPCVKALEQGVTIPAQEGGRDKLEVQSSSTFEANISFALRFLVDHDLGGGRWVELPAGSYHTTPKPQSTAQIEVCAPCEGLRAVSADDEVGSSVPPVRTLALEVLVDADGQLCAAACALAVQGEKCLHARGVWVRREPLKVTTDEWEEVKVDVYDPDQAEPPKVFICDDDAVLLDHLGQTLELIDADILLTYDLPRTFHGLLGKKGIAKAGCALARGLSRCLSAELKVTPKSNDVSGLIGRLGFDLQKQVEKEHRLTDYSLGGLAEHFCRAPMPELREVDLAQLRMTRPRAFAQHALRQAEATLTIFDQLAFLFNFVEMARVTGCPLSYLLERGQAVKVQAQLLREARQRGFVLPSQRPSTGEDVTFEGATVLEPACGFYRSPVAVLDFASLYPSIMMAHNLCYSTLLPAGRERHPDAPPHSPAPTSNVSTEERDVQAACFVNATVRKGLLPSILEQLLAARQAAKKQLALCPATADTQRKVLHGRQLALKLSANSVYGFTGATNGPLPCLELAGAVTAYGRQMIQDTKALMQKHFVRSNGYKHDARVLYGDTDSVMVCFGPDDMEMEEAIELSRKAVEVCSAIFPPPKKLEFEKVYRPFLLMNKKRYAGLAWTSTKSMPNMEMKGIETVRRDWSDLVRQGVERTLQLLLRPDGSDGTAEATAYVRALCDELRQNRIDFRSLVISKSLGRDEYATKAPHVEVAEKIRKRNPANAPSAGDRVNYLVLAGAAKAKVHERAEDPLYALEHDLPVDAEYYLDHQLKQPLLRVFEHVCGSVQKAEHLLFGTCAGQVVVAASASTKRGMGKFMKARPKCLACSTANANSDSDPFCGACEAKGADHEHDVRERFLAQARRLRAELEEFRAHCQVWCSAPSGAFPELPPDTPESAEGTVPETCPNLNCQVIFRRAKAAKDLKVATDALARLKVMHW